MCFHWLWVHEHKSEYTHTHTHIIYIYIYIQFLCMYKLDISTTMAARSKSWTVFDRSNTVGLWVGIPLYTRMPVSVYSIFVISCVYAKAMRHGDSRSKYYQLCMKLNKTNLRGLKSASELYRPSDCGLSAKLVSTFVDRGWHVVNVTDPYRRILGLLDRSRYCSFQVAIRLYLRGWVEPDLDPLLFRKSGRAGNRTLTSGAVARNSGH
jgi:hypothetical protein